MVIKTRIVRALPHLALVALLLTLAACARTEEVEGNRRTAEREVTVETQEAERRAWMLMARAVGSLSADEAIAVRSEVAGRVVELSAREGDEVAEGDVLLRLDDERAQYQLKQAHAHLNEIQADYDRQIQLHAQGLISDAERITVEARRQAAEADVGLMARHLADHTIVAPIDGTLGRRHVARGDYIGLGERVFELVQLDRLKLDFELPERYLPQVKPGLDVGLRTAAYPDKRFQGVVVFVDPVIQPLTRTVSLRAELDNRDRLLRPNQFVQVDLAVSVIEDAIAVPEEAILSDMGGFSVYVVDADERAEFRSVTLGEREPGSIQIAEGIEAGERVVVTGHQRLQPGTRVREREHARGN